MKGSLLQAACGMEIFMNSIIGNKKARSAVEQTAEIIFTICAFFAVLAVISITVYMFLNGTPALTKVGLTEILLFFLQKQLRSPSLKSSAPPLSCSPVFLPLSTVCSVSCCCALQCINSSRKSLQALRPISLPAVQTLFLPCLSLRS